MNFKCSPSRGYALATVMIFTTLLCLMAAALLRYSSAEMRLNQRNQLRFQAKNAAEAMLEYGASELMARLQKKVNIPSGSTGMSANPLTTPTSRKSTLYATASTNNVAPANLSFWASQFTEPTDRYVDPTDPGNRYDPLQGQWVRAQSVKFLAAATSSAPGLTETQYATQSIEIRDVYIFKYAIFYNITMEFHPGPNMVVTGPVHSNFDTYLTSTAGVSLKFMSTFTTAGLFNAGALASGRPTGTDVYFSTKTDANPTGAPIAINDTSIKSSTLDSHLNAMALGTPYVDSHLADRATYHDPFGTIASQTWHGNIQDSTMGIIPMNVPGLDPSDPTKTASQNAANAQAQSHSMIETPDTSASPNANLEARKYSNNAGLYIFQGAADASGNPPAPVAFTNAADANTYRAITTATARASWVTSNKDKVIQLPTNMVTNSRRMYDFREAATINTVDIDVGVLRTAVNSTTTNATSNLKTWDTTTSSNKDWNLDASSGGWNGQVYVEVEQPTAGYTTTSDITGVGTGTGTRTAVRLINGSQVPNRKEAVGGATTADGFTLATNAPAYIVGNLNSPGVNAGTRGGTSVGTEADTVVGTPKDNEAPVSVVADAVNIISNAWMSSGKPIGDASSATSSRPAASNTEISAAILTGNVPTSSGGSSYSGGVENFPRFLENWSGKTFRYRGSMVALFNSMIATGPWSRANYSPPTRVWGFNTMFAAGRQPPGAPMLRTFRRVTYGDLTPTQFNALLTNATLNFTSM